MQIKNKEFMKTLGNIIKNHRQLSGKSIYKISAESFITKSTWLRIENGNYKDINLTSLWKIAEGLEISPDIILKQLKEELGKNFSLIDE